MARPLNIGKRLKSLVDDFISSYVGSNPSGAGRPALTPKQLQTFNQAGRIRAEKPTRDFDTFAFVQEVLANMPAANAALWQLAEDVALDESGDPRAWSLSIKADPIDDTAENKTKIDDFSDQCQRIFDDWALRTGIGYNTKSYVFKFVSAGSCFVEQVPEIDTSTGMGRVESINELPTWQMREIWDDTGKTVSYQQWRTINDNSPITWQIPAQIIHWKYRPTRYIPGGQSCFIPLRGRWEQFKLVELDTIAAIHTRAVDPEITLLGRKDGYDRLTDDELRLYEQKLRENPTDLNRFYVGRLGEVEYVFPKTGSADAVSKLVDAHKDLERRFIEAATGIPNPDMKDVAGRHVSTSLDQRYAHRVGSLRQDFTFYLKPAVLLEFALHGININKPEQYGAKNISFEISWPNLSETPTQRSARVIKEWTAGAIPLAEALRQLGHNDPQGLIELMKREREDGILPLLTITGGTTPNGSQGKGVPTSTSDPSSNSLLGFWNTPEEFRDIIREEISSALQK